MDFNFTKEQQMLKDMIYKFTDNEVRPQQLIWDKEPGYPIKIGCRHMLNWVCWTCLAGKIRRTGPELS
jgi:alkylation response protein AidB-like acyl-CoA dehydrogenase